MTQDQTKIFTSTLRFSLSCSVILCYQLGSGIFFWVQQEVSSSRERHIQGINMRKAFIYSQKHFREWKKSKKKPWILISSYICGKVVPKFQRNLIFFCGPEIRQLTFLAITDFRLDLCLCLSSGSARHLHAGKSYASIDFLSSNNSPPVAAVTMLWKLVP